MATHTRMMTMEAANESARHAVTALLHNLLRQSSDSNMKGAGVLFGDLPEFFDPERHEPAGPGREPRGR